MAQALPQVVIAGRPNVGKSSLVNRFVQRRIAVVEESPGITRDRNVLEAEWNGVTFSVVDTGGWMGAGTELDAKVARQSERALNEADLILFVVDVNVGITAEDEIFAQLVRRASAPVRLVVNKVDDTKHEPAIWEFMSLGLGDPWPISALHGRGTGDLLDEVVGVIAPTGAELVAEPSDMPDLVEGGEVSVVFVGRPNVGKSTLFNRLIGDERSIVHDEPGTTRDAIDTVVQTDEGEIRFIDTAGMRKPARTDEGTEHYSVLRSLDALARAHVAVLVIDATIGATHQDQRLAERIGTSGCAPIVVLNKWDLLATQQRPDVLELVADRLAFLADAPVLKISAKSGQGVHKLLPAIGKVVAAYHQRIGTGALNRALRDLQETHPATGARIRYGVQGASDPPTFTLFATARLPEHYLRYIERFFRERFELGPTPIRLRVRVQ